MGFIESIKQKFGDRFRFFAKLYYAVSLLILVICIGTFGFMLVEGWDFLESFYMSIISISTVGFQEVHPLSPSGQIFTAFLIISSFGIFGFAITSITTYLVGGEYRNYLKTSKVMKEIDKLDNHIIICGFGRVGRQAANEMKAHDCKYVVIERDKTTIEKYNLSDDYKDVLFLEGEATQDDSLVKAGIERARALIIALPNDADNLFVVVTARELNRKTTIISRASKDSSVKKLKLGGASNVIMPDKVGGSHMASLVITPDVMEFMDLIRVSGEAKSNIEEIEFSKLANSFSFQSIQDLDAKKVSGCNIIGYRSSEKDYFINPSPETIVEPGSKLFVLGTPKQIEKLKTYVGENTL